MSNQVAKSPVLLVIFNRPSTTVQVFGAIRQYKPERLYIASDGPRAGRETDPEKIKQCRDIVSQVDWHCEVFHLYRDENLGCKFGVSSAITWFFEQEEMGIILEDDCLPGEEFFDFCTGLLDRYKHDERVMHIGGSNLQFGQKRGNKSYYFSSIASVWGWASWRRVWKNYEHDMPLFEEFRQEDLIYDIFAERRTAAWVQDILGLVYEDKIEAWDYRLAFSIVIRNGICITPNENLVTNIGFTDEGTNTTNSKDVHANIPIGEIGQITHPDFFIVNRAADIYQLNLSIPKPGPPPDNRSAFRKAGSKVKGIVTGLFK